MTTIGKRSNGVQSKVLKAVIRSAVLAALAVWMLPATADTILPNPRPVKGAQERPQDPVEINTVPTGRFDMQNQATRALKQAKVNSMRMGMGFLLQNKAAPGVKTLKSGVQYKVITAGEGPKPSKDGSVEVNYSARLVDGTVFASSEQGKPATLRMSAVVPGLAEALRKMKSGSKWEVVIPPDQGYGDTGALPTIPPGAVLIYELELVGAKPESGKAVSRGDAGQTAGDTTDLPSE